MRAAGALGNNSDGRWDAAAGAKGTSGDLVTRSRDGGVEAAGLGAPAGIAGRRGARRHRSRPATSGKKGQVTRGGYFGSWEPEGNGMPLAQGSLGGPDGVQRHLRMGPDE